MNIVACLRVKNEARWIHECIRSIQPLCERILIIDDHSTDGTPQYASALQGVIVIPSPFEGLDEARDKNHLVEIAVRVHKADWILMIDGDEALEPKGPMKLIDAIKSGAAPAYTLQVAFLWDSFFQVRVDGVYRDFTRPSLFQTADSTCEFVSQARGGGFHCANVPHDLRGRSMPSGAVLKHYGYLYQKDRLKKYKWYNRMDPNNRLEDEYRHIVQGDLPEIPATANLRHAGPMEFKPWT